MICPICQNETNDTSKFCIKCGVEIPRCPVCNQVLRKRMRFCVSCGSKLPESALRAFGTPEAQDNPPPVAASVNEKPVEASNSVKPEASPEVLHQRNPGTTLPESDETQEPKPMAATMPPMTPTPASEPGNPPAIVHADVKQQKKVRYCLQCGKPCDSDQPICRSCQMRPQELNQQKQAAVSSTDELPAEKPTRKKKGVGRIILVVLIVVMLLALAGGGFFFAMRFMQDKKNDEKSPNEVTVMEQTPETSELPEEPAGEPASLENPEPTEPEKTTTEPVEAIEEPVEAAEEPESVPTETDAADDTIYNMLFSDTVAWDIMNANYFGSDLVTANLGGWADKWIYLFYYGSSDPTTEDITARTHGVPLESWLRDTIGYDKAKTAGWGDAWLALIAKYAEPSSALTSAQDKLLYFVNNCDSMYFTKADLEDFDASMAILARNAPYAHAGRKFTNDTIRTYFEQFAWYTPLIEPDAFKETMLNAYETANKNLVVEFEKEKGYK